jgi:hypothetical protein
MTAACSLLEAELALDRIEAELATELPPHMRAFAAAHAANASSPPAPPVLLRASTVIQVRQALPHPLLEDRARLVARLAFPAAIEVDPRVAAIRARFHDGANVLGPTWDDYAVLAAARDQVARERFDRPFVDLMHDLHGLRANDLANDPAAWPAAVDGWHARDTALSSSALDAMWREIAMASRLPGAVRILRGDRARARTFVVEPKREVIVVLPQLIDTPAARFAALHEFGHALVALLIGEVPRVLDEAVASFVARRMEDPGSPWSCTLAAAARVRRVAVARVLDQIERGTSAGASTAWPTERPPWALWHDPGAQGAYVAAEAIADSLDGRDLAASIASRMPR